MPASIIVSNLGWSTPDGAPVLTDLTLQFGPERTGLVGRNGTGKTTLLHLLCGKLTPLTGTVLVHGSLARLRQEVQVGADETIAELFGATAALALLDQAEAGLADVEALADADWTLPARLEPALLRCGLDCAPPTRLATLSGGQLTRAGLAALIFAEPDFLLLDEPTNNLDRDGRNSVIELLAGWRSGAIVVSHDRELLQEMDAIVELNGLGAVRYGGPYSAYRTARDAQLQAAGHDLADAEKWQAELARKAQQARERKARKDSAGRLARKKNDQPKILLDGKKARSEATGGANARLREARRSEADNALHAARERIEVLQPIRMDIAPTHLPAGRTVLRLDGVSGGHDPARPVIRELSLTVTGPERLAITGRNGSGKTTLLGLIAGALRPLGGVVTLGVPYALLDQSVSLLQPDETLRDNFRRLNPAADELAGRAALARFKFRADDALQLAGTLSGGQRLRAGLACTLGRAEPPPLLILDEPTNHLDLDAMEALEGALAGYDGALLVVSHDEMFLARLQLDRRLELVDGQLREEW